jgi:hypothetical protein
MVGTEREFGREFVPKPRQLPINLLPKAEDWRSTAAIVREIFRDPARKSAWIGAIWKKGWRTGLRAGEGRSL